MPALSGLNVLSLRTGLITDQDLPFGQLTLDSVQKSGSLIRRLENLGATCYHYPVIKIQASTVDDERIKQQITSFSHYDKAIVVSQHAAQLACCWLNRYYPMLPEGIDYFAVGPTSAQPLCDQGVVVGVPESAYCSEALLEMRALNTVRDQKIMIFRGGQGRELLERTLRTRGAIVECCELYRRVVDQTHGKVIGRLIQSEIPLVLIYSDQILRALLKIIPEVYLAMLKKLPIIVPSERVGNLARKKGFFSVYVAASALPEDVEHSVSDWYTHAR